jgi:hypothetical protein
MRMRPVKAEKHRTRVGSNKLEAAEGKLVYRHPCYADQVEDRWRIAANKPRSKFRKCRLLGGHLDEW